MDECLLFGDVGTAHGIFIKDREDYFKVLVALSVGLGMLKDVHLKDAEVAEIVALWKENYCEF